MTQITESSFQMPLLPHDANRCAICQFLNRVVEEADRRYSVLPPSNSQENPCSEKP